MLNVDDASISGISSIGGGGTLTTNAATLDLSNKFVSAAITSNNTAGTIFTVTDANTASHVLGGTGNDTLVAQGFSFTSAQRNAIFVQGSVETIIDGTGSYVGPIKLTTAADTVAGSPSDVTVVATASTLNDGDALDGGAGFDVLALFGGGTFHLDTLAQLDGFEQISVNPLYNSSWDGYLRNGVDTAVVVDLLFLHAKLQYSFGCQRDCYD